MLKAEQLTVGNLFIIINKMNQLDKFLRFSANIIPKVLFCNSKTYAPVKCD